MRSCERALSIAALILVAAQGVAFADAQADYRRHCAPCHGDDGDGRGPAAHLLEVQPRDFTTGLYKFRSTPSGALPSDEDLLRVIDEGLPGTAMPGWKSILPAARRKALVAVIKDFSPRFARRGAPEPMALPDEPPPDPSAATRGRAVYERLKCAECHGKGGKGDGPAAPTLRDDHGRFIPTPDLTKGESLRSRMEKDLLRVIYTGMNGTPMPSYGESIQPDEAWDLVRYLYGLRQPVCWWRTLLFEPPLVWRHPGD